MGVNKEREDFEAEFSKIKSDIAFWLHTWDEEMQGYNHPVMCWFWYMWQAAKAQAVPEWISVEDGLPNDGQDIIAFDAIKHCVFKDGEFLQGYFEPDTGHEYTEPVDVTHWIAIEAQEQSHE